MVLGMAALFLGGCLAGGLPDGSSGPDVDEAKRPLVALSPDELPADLPSCQARYGKRDLWPESKVLYTIERQPRAVVVVHRGEAVCVTTRQRYWPTAAADLLPSTEPVNEQAPKTSSASAKDSNPLPAWDPETPGDPEDPLTEPSDTDHGSGEAEDSNPLPARGNGATPAGDSNPLPAKTSEETAESTEALLSLFESEL